MCKAFLKEAKWYYSGYKPTLDQEYMENGAVSSAAPIVLFCAYFLTADKITVEALDYIDKLPSIMWCSSMILRRLTNDLGTSSVCTLTLTQSYMCINCIHVLILTRFACTLGRVGTRR